MWRRVRIGQVLGFVLIIIALPTTINDGIAGWAGWLGWIAEREWQWAFLVGGFVIVLGSSLLDRIRVRPHAADATVSPPREREAERPAGEPQPVAPTPAETLSPLREAVWTEGTLQRRLANLVMARVEQVRALRSAFDAYIETFLARRAEYHEGMTEDALERAREEYGELQRAVARTYRAVRDHYRRFLREEPQYDRSSSDPDNYVPEEPLSSWWEPLTFDAALNQYANAADAHLRPIIAEERAILATFEEWIAEPRHHELAGDLEGANLEDDEILGLIRRRVEQLEERGAALRERATVSARQGSISGRQFADQYTFEVMNTGPVAAARRAQAWAAYPDGPPVTAPVDLHTLPPDHRWYEVRLDISPRAFREQGLNFVVAWEDDAGRHEEVLLDIRPLRR